MSTKKYACEFFLNHTALSQLILLLFIGQLGKSKSLFSLPSGIKKK